MLIDALLSFEAGLSARSHVMRRMIYFQSCELMIIMIPLLSGGLSYHHYFFFDITYFYSHVKCIALPHFQGFFLYLVPHI